MPYGLLVEDKKDSDDGRIVGPSHIFNLLVCQAASAAAGPQTRHDVSVSGVGCLVSQAAELHTPHCRPLCDEGGYMNNLQVGFQSAVLWQGVELTANGLDRDH